jgi:hypothetical protein
MVPGSNRERLPDGHWAFCRANLQMRQAFSSSRTLVPPGTRPSSAICPTGHHSGWGCAEATSGWFHSGADAESLRARRGSAHPLKGDD